MNQLTEENGSWVWVFGSGSRDESDRKVLIFDTVDTTLYPDYHFGCVYMTTMDCGCPDREMVVSCFYKQKQTAGGEYVFSVLIKNLKDSGMSRQTNGLVGLRGSKIIAQFIHHFLMKCPKEMYEKHYYTYDEDDQYRAALCNRHFITY